MAASQTARNRETFNILGSKESIHALPSFKEESEKGKEVMANYGIYSFCRHVEILFILSWQSLFWLNLYVRFVRKLICPGWSFVLAKL